MTVLRENTNGIPERFPAENAYLILRLAELVSDAVAKKIRPVEDRVAERVRLTLDAEVNREIQNAVRASLPIIAKAGADEALKLVRAEMHAYTAAVAATQAAVERQLAAVEKMAKLAAKIDTQNWQTVLEHTASIKGMHQGYWRFITEKLRDIREFIRGGSVKTLTAIVAKEVEDYQLEAIIRDEIRSAVRLALRDKPTAPPAVAAAAPGSTADSDVSN
jgi:hypothetical protein